MCKTFPNVASYPKTCWKENVDWKEEAAKKRELDEEYALTLAIQRIFKIGVLIP